MANLISALKSEIVRLARKEVKAATESLHRPSVAARSAIADLNRRVVVLEKECKRLNALLATAPTPAPQSDPAPVNAKNWVSGKGIRSLRRKLGLSQAEFAKLVGVTSKAVGLWEGKPGVLRMRDATKASVMAVRGIGAREAKRRLEAAQ